MRPSTPILCAALVALAVLPPAALGADPAAAPAFPPPEVRAWQTGLLRADRVQHFSFAMTSGLMIGAASEEPAAAVTGALTLGLAKELWDLRRTGFDGWDLAADALGAAASGVIINAVTR